MNGAYGFSGLSCPPMTLRALIFDVDGTLAETEQEGHLPAFNATFARAGLGWTWEPELYGRLLAVTGGQRSASAITPERHHPGHGRGGISTPWCASCTRPRRAITWRGWGRRIPLRPGIAALIAEARAAGLPIAIATTRRRRTDGAARNLAGPRQHGWFAAIGRGTPSRQRSRRPTLYLWVLEGWACRRRIAWPRRIRPTGSGAALAAGIPAVVTEARTPVARTTGALAVLPDLAGTDLAAH